MGSRIQNPAVSKSLENFSRGLLATTCLTVACGASAVAGTITEGTLPAPGDFSNASNGYLLPLGTTVVNGTVGGNLPNEGGVDTADWFEFQGLTGSGVFNVTGVFNPLGVEAGGRFFVFNDIGTQLASGSLEGGGQTLNGIIPDDGNLVVEVTSARQAGYSISFAAGAPGVPEPATFGLTGLTLAAGALAWKRRRKQS